jgi:hypothetical protein
MLALKEKRELSYRWRRKKGQADKMEVGLQRQQQQQQRDQRRFPCWVSAARKTGKEATDSRPLRQTFSQLKFVFKGTFRVQCKGGCSHKQRRYARPVAFAYIVSRPSLLPSLTPVSSSALLRTLLNWMVQPWRRFPFESQLTSAWPCRFRTGVGDLSFTLPPALSPHLHSPPKVGVQDQDLPSQHFVYRQGVSQYFERGWKPVLDVNHFTDSFTSFTNQ